MFQVVLNSLVETEDFANNFIVTLLPAINLFGVQVALEGELGSGKTSFVASVMRSLKYNDPVSSPTYILENQYTSPDGIFVRHWDLYRIATSSTPEELFEPLQPKELRLIEWASRSPELAEYFDMKLFFEIISESQRLLDLDLLDIGLKKGIQF